MNRKREEKAGLWMIAVSTSGFMQQRPSIFICVNVLHIDFQHAEHDLAFPTSCPLTAMDIGRHTGPQRTQYPQR